MVQVEINMWDALIDSMFVDKKETVFVILASSTYHLGLRTKREKEELRSRDKHGTEVSGL